MSARRVIYLFLCFTPWVVTGQKHFDFNVRCRQAYQAIIQMKLDEGERILAMEQKRDPSNLIPAFLENYIDFFILYFNEDPAEYEARKGMQDARIDLMSSGPSSSPFYLFTKSVIHFQWAAINVKFGNNWDAGWEFRRSLLQCRENQEKFPGFEPSIMLGGAMQVVAATIPDGYKWLSSLLGIKGNLATGMQAMTNFLASKDEWAGVFHEEAVFYYLYLTFYIQNQRAQVFDYISRNKLDLVNNYLYAYLAANLGINDQRGAFAEQVIRQRSTVSGYMETPVWDLELGYASLYHLKPDAHIYLERFLRDCRGKFYVKDALQKLSWYYYLQGNDGKAAEYRSMILRRGGMESDADKQAMKDAKSGKWPEKTLLRARLLCDGGYFGEALQSLQGKSTVDFGTPQDKCEFAYRLGRIYDGLGRSAEAIPAYLTTLKTGAGLREYYAARAALQIGYIYEQQGNKAMAVAYFEKCLSLKDHDYKNSLDQKAKAGIARCNGE